MFGEREVIEQIFNKTGLKVRPETLAKFAAAKLINAPISTPRGLYYLNDTPRKFAKAAKRMAKSDQFKSNLVKRQIVRDGDKITMLSTYDHSGIYQENYNLRMSGDKGYIDRGKDLMRVARIPIETLAAMTEEERHELDTPKGLVKYLQQNPRFKASAANL